MKFKKTLNSSGDTIVEVLIVLAVLSLSFATSYSIAIKALGQARNAQEHSETLGNIDSQVEWLRYAIAHDVNPSLPVNRPFCMKSPTTYDDSFPATYTVTSSAANDNLSSYPIACTNGLYYSRIIYSGPTGPADGNFDIIIRWDGNASLGRQQEEINYRTYKLVPDTSPGITPAVTLPPPITPPAVDACSAEEGITGGVTDQPCIPTAPPPFDPCLDQPDVAACH